MTADLVEPRLRYPEVDRDDVVESRHGVEVADPYRWLEDPDAPRTRAFVAAQNALSRPYLDELPARAPLLALTTALLTAPRRGVPWERGGRYFVVANPGELDQDQLFWADDLDGLLTAPRLLLDPNGLSADGTVAMTAARVSPDGALLAYAVSEAGSDWRTIRVRDVGSGQDRPDELHHAKWIDPTWLPDASGFLFWRYPDTAGGELTEAMGAGELVLHRLAADPAAAEVIWTPPDRDWMADPWVAPDGRWLVLTASPGTDSRTLVAAHRLRVIVGRPVVDPVAVPVVAELADAHHVVGSDGDTLYLRTERDAPRGRLVAVDLSGPGANGRAASWVEVVAQHDDDVLVEVRPARGAFALVWSTDAAHRLELVDRSGAHLAWPALPSPVSMAAVNTRAGSAEILLGVSSFLRRTRLFRLDVDAPGELRPRPGPGGEVPLPAMRADRRRAVSTDGVAVPMTVLRRADLPAGPAPTLLYGYGGFDIPLLPAFSAMFAAWVAAGGVLVVANLRGGGEFGATWHEAGMRHRKQQVFDDLIACAESLVATGVTTPAQLAVHGRSNGGLLVGAVMTQRPDLFAAALPTVGVLDMLRFHLFTIGWAWTSDYGSPDDPDDFGVLLAYSPLHRLAPGTAYPATLICTGDHDDRVVPAHSLKFGAHLQFCQAGPAPVLLRVDTRAGHGMGKPARALALEYADQLAFAARHTGMTLRDPE
ncbi:prolyl oligopeptidase family serine peptidase [Nakamurella sp.]|uniref:prolyl oligopeptidase family serine peptidase n=1 Tax=Nakamurella sp. TaxID=1869182 RepID=UPI003B3B8114